MSADRAAGTSAGTRLTAMANRPGVGAARWAAICVIAAGTCTIGGSGAPFFPHPAAAHALESSAAYTTNVFTECIGSDPGS